MRFLLIYYAYFRLELVFLNLHALFSMQFNSDFISVRLKRCPRMALRYANLIGNSWLILLISIIIIIYKCIVFSIFQIQTLQRTTNVVVTKNYILTLFLKGRDGMSKRIPFQDVQRQKEWKKKFKLSLIFCNRLFWIT